MENAMIFNDVEDFLLKEMIIIHFLYMAKDQDINLSRNADLIETSGTL